MDPLLIAILATLAGAFLGALGWIFRKWLDSLIHNITSAFDLMKTDFTQRFEDLNESIEDIKDIQGKQGITMTEMKSELSSTKEIVKETKKNVDDHSTKIHELEVEQARLSQWKKDKEDSKDGKF